MSAKTASPAASGYSNPRKAIKPQTAKEPGSGTTGSWAMVATRKVRRMVSVAGSRLSRLSDDKVLGGVQQEIDPRAAAESAILSRQIIYEVKCRLLPF